VATSAGDDEIADEEQEDASASDADEEKTEEETAEALVGASRLTPDSECRAYQPRIDE